MRFLLVTAASPCDPQHRHPVQETAGERRTRLDYAPITLVVLVRLCQDTPKPPVLEIG
jgi:hypothetical protein